MIKKPYFEGCLWLSLSVFLGINSILLDLGTLTSPGPGLMPFVLALFLFLLSLVMLVNATLLQKEKTEQRFDLGIRAFYASSLIVGYVFIFKKVGFLISTFLLMTFLFRSMGTKRWILALGEASLAAFLSYLFFGVILKLNLRAF